MARAKLKPVSIWGVEFDALIDEDETYNSTIPTYPVENGFPVSDTIINDPISISLTLFISNTPVTWIEKHGHSTSRVKKVCEQLENKWHEKKLTKIVTTDKIFTNMGITSMSIRKSTEYGYDRQVSISAQKVVTTKKKTVTIPKYALKAGKTKANAGTASTSTTSSKSSSSSSKSSSSSSKSSSQGKKKSGSKSKGSSAAKKNQSLLYGAASNLGFI